MTRQLNVCRVTKDVILQDACREDGQDILSLRGQAMTSLNALVLDVFEFRDREGLLPDLALAPLLSDAVAGRTIEWVSMMAF